MELMTVESVADFLNQEFMDVDPEMIEDLLLRPNDGADSDLIELKKGLNINALPEDFERLICQYDFGNFSIQNIQFGYEDSYFERLKELNNQEQYWYSDAKAAGVIVIGNGDPFTVLLHLKEKSIYAISAEIPFSQKIKIANSFTHFIEGMGTAFMAKRKNREKEFLELAAREFGIDSLQFWKQSIR